MENPARVVPAQRRYITFPEQRFMPIRAETAGAAAKCSSVGLAVPLPLRVGCLSRGAGAGVHTAYKGKILRRMGAALHQLLLEQSTGRGRKCCS